MVDITVCFCYVNMNLGKLVTLCYIMDKEGRER